MEEKDPKTLKRRFVLVKDQDGKEYVCRIEDLKNPDELTEDEKAACFPPPPAFE